MRTLEERVTALEGSNRRWRLAAGLLGLLLLIGVAVAARRDGPAGSVVRTRRLVVLAPDGQASIILSADDRQAMLSLRGGDGERGILLGADEEAVQLILMKNQEAPLFSARAEDQGASLWIWDGREQSEKPNAIVMSSMYSGRRGGGQAMVNLTRGLQSSDIEAGLYMGGRSQGTFLLLGGRRDKTAKLQVDQRTGRIEFLDEDDKVIWSSR